MKPYIKILLPLIFSIILVAGILIGNWYGSNFSTMGYSMNKLPSATSIKGRSSTDGSLPSFSYSNKLNAVMSYIEHEYVDTINSEKVTDLAIPAILNELDPHSVYIPASELKKFNEPLVGNFSGIGVQFNMNNDTVAIINTIPNGPSEIVGILPGDRIIKVNGKDVSGVKMPSDSVVTKLKGPKGTTVRVSINRRGNPDLLEFVITRDDIPLYSVDVAYMINERTGFIKISTFSQTTHNEFVEAVGKLHQQGMKNLIIDLRRNSGGVMDAATDIADEFLDDKKLIVYTQGRARSRNDVISRPGGICVSDEVVVLIDEFSASASEIFAGAIQDNDRGTIIGRRSFGKGLVQEQIYFRDGSAMRLTIARYYTPTGRCIQKPYGRDKSSYFMDIQDRIIHGEFENADSIHFEDSLKYITPGGKTVFGGGGIMPDIFIPLDTSGLSSYFEKVTNQGLIYRFAFDYWDKNREHLGKYKTAPDISKYLDKSGYFNEFLNYASSRGVPVNYKEINTSRKLLEIQLKAYIARNIIDSNGFYPIIQEIDNTLQKAVSVMN